MNISFATRMHHVHESFVREILKVTQNPEIISFAGGLPNPQFFPVQELADAAAKVLRQNGKNVLQYTTTEGHLPLREYIAHRYWQRFGLKVDPAEILITNGSQQGLDLIGKIFLDKGDQIILERPSFLGAIQAFSLYRAEMLTVPLHENGLDIALFEQTLRTNNVKLFYAVPNFQNPSGITHSEQNRRDTAQLLKKHKVTFIEDDPYGELRFRGQDLPSIGCYLNGNSILCGSFSKIISPGLRLGWICAKRKVMEKLIVAKQAADLHSNHLSQQIIYQYLLDHDLNSHLTKIREAYGRQRDLMISMIETHFSDKVSYTQPEGGMFLWLTLPKGVSSMDLFNEAARLNVVFVPGKAFYPDQGGTNTLRLNYSNADEEKIEEGMKRLAQALNELLAQKKTYPKKANKMKPFTSLTSRMVSIPIENIDTDQIIPAQFLKVTDKNGLAENLFFNWRYLPDGSPNPDFILNQARAKGVKILVAGDNFGCGSSREHAPWALNGYGFQVIISTSFADIFRNNALKNGLLPVVVDKETHLQLQSLAEEDPDTAIAIDLSAQTVTLPDGRKVNFPIDSFSKNCIIKGLDQLGYLKDHAHLVEKYETTHPARVNTLG